MGGWGADGCGWLASLESLLSKLHKRGLDAQGSSKNCLISASYCTPTVTKAKSVWIAEQNQHDAYSVSVLELT